MQGLEHLNAKYHPAMYVQRMPGGSDLYFNDLF